MNLEMSALLTNLMKKCDLHIVNFKFILLLKQDFFQMLDFMLEEVVE